MLDRLEMFIFLLRRHFSEFSVARAFSKDTRMATRDKNRVDKEPVDAVNTPSLPGPLMEDPISIARVYPNANTDRASDYWDYDRVSVKWG